VPARNEPVEHLQVRPEDVAGADDADPDGPIPGQSVSAPRSR
jgi:hypothetical protein